MSARVPAVHRSARAFRSSRPPHLDLPGDDVARDPLPIGTRDLLESAVNLAVEMAAAGLVDRDHPKPCAELALVSQRSAHAEPVSRDEAVMATKAKATIAEVQDERLLQGHDLWLAAGRVLDDSIRVDWQDRGQQAKTPRRSRSSMLCGSARYS